MKGESEDKRLQSKPGLQDNPSIDRGPFRKGEGEFKRKGRGGYTTEAG